MALLIYGIKKAPVGLTEVMERCPHCETDNFCEVYITSNYYHIYFIPIFPIAKEATVVCHKCGLRRRDVPLDKDLFKNYAELNRKFKHPWYTWSLILLISIPILIAVLYNL